MGLEEQKEEREVLDSIFPDEITDISETEYRLSIALDEPGADDQDDPEHQTEPPIILLRVSYPPTYPDTAPGLEISAPPNAPKHALLDIPNDKASLLDSLTPIITENLGIAMIFTLASALKEAAESLMGERAAAAQAIRDKEAARAEAEENCKFEGTRVTRETFLAWRAEFRAEVAAEEEAKRMEEKEVEERRRRGPVVERKLTGKELWEKGLAGKGEGEDVDADADADADAGANGGGEVVDGVQELKIEG